MHRMLMAVSVLLVSFVCAGSAESAPEQPDIVVFISDDHGYLDTAANAGGFSTPNLDRLSAAGMTFTQAFAASPTCAPSRAALLTGMFPLRNGSMLNHQPPKSEVKKLPAYLHELGYEVVAFGKVAHYKQGKDYGFDHVSHDTFHDDECVHAALEFLENRTSTKPLCLFVGTNWPHVPWPPAEKRTNKDGDNSDSNGLPLPPTFVDTPETRAWRARYAAAVERFDRELGAVYDQACKRLGNDTLFIHFSDNGAQWPLAKWNLYDAGTRVPFVVVWPGVVKPGSHSNALVSLVDVLPTIVEAAGGTPPQDIDGRSLVPILRGEQTSHRDFIFTTHSGDGKMNAYPLRSIRTPRWKYIRNLQPSGQHHTHIDLAKPVDGNEYWRSWVKQGKTDPAAAAIVKRYHSRPAEELYDLDVDPYEQNNLAEDEKHTATRQELRALLDRTMEEQHDSGMKTEQSLKL